MKSSMFILLILLALLLWGSSRRKAGSTAARKIHKNTPSEVKQMYEFLQNYIGRRLTISTINDSVYGDLVSVEEKGIVLNSIYEKGSVIFVNFEYITSISVGKARKVKDASAG